jgi:HlyD family secretion protein
VKRRIVRTIVVLAVIALGTAIAIAVPRLPERANQTPTAKVTKGPLKLTVHATGELRAGRTMTLVTPPVGGTLRIVTLVPTGVAVKTGDPVMEFDPADQQYALEQARSELAEAEQTIVKMKADGVVQASQDQVALLTARFDVRRAELDVTGNEFISPINGQKNLLSLEEAKRRLAQLEEDVKSRSLTSQASLAVGEERRNKAQLSMQRAQQVIDSLIIKSPIDGVVSLKENRDASGGMFFFGMVLPEYRLGDSVWPGRPIADVIEAGRMEVRAKVDESDRANLSTGQPAKVYVDTLPGSTFEAKVGALSELANRASFFEASSITRQFDITFQFAQQDGRLRAGSSARVVIEGKEIPDALQVPRQAVFEKNGKTHVFVKVGERFDPREVKVAQRTESRVALAGITEGTEVALIDPTVGARKSSATTASPMPAAGGSK